MNTQFDFLDNISSPTLRNDMKTFREEDPDLFEESLNAILGQRILSGEDVEGMTEFEKKRAVKAYEKQTKELNDILSCL